MSTPSLSQVIAWAKAGPLPPNLPAKTLREVKLIIGGLSPNDPAIAHVEAALRAIPRVNAPRESGDVVVYKVQRPASKAGRSAFIILPVSSLGNVNQVSVRFFDGKIEVSVAPEGEPS